MLRYLFAWLPMVGIAIANGVAREALYAPHVSELAAHQISTALAAVMLGAYIWAVVRYWPPASARQALAAGLMWLAMTVAFEFLFGHYVAGHSWARLLQDYDLTAGRVWPLLLAWVTLAPWTFCRRQRRR